MIRNCIKVTWRNLWNNKRFSLLNLVTLTSGLSASFGIALMVYHEFILDKFHENVDQIYRVTTEYKNLKNCYSQPFGKYKNRITAVQPAGEDVL